MSLYNLVCGSNPLYEILLSVVGRDTPLPEIPRFRDVYTMMNGDDPLIVIYTRTGGGNRAEYTEQNAALGRHPLFVRDYDDDFDSTYAHFEFLVPEDLRQHVTVVHETFSLLPKGTTPRVKFERALAALDDKEEKPPYQPTHDQIVVLQGALDQIIDSVPALRARVHGG